MSGVDAREITVAFPSGGIARAGLGEGSAIATPAASP
jgi:hypothetical protein